MSAAIELTSGDVTLVLETGIREVALGNSAVGNPTAGSYAGGYATLTANTVIADAVDAINKGLAALSGAIEGPPLAGTPTDGSWADGLAAIVPSDTLAEALDKLNEAAQGLTVSGSQKIGNPTAGSWAGYLSSVTANTPVKDAIQTLGVALATVQTAAAVAGLGTLGAAPSGAWGSGYITGITSSSTVGWAIYALDAGLQSVAATASAPGVRPIGTPTSGTWATGYASVIATQSIADALAVVNVALRNVSNALATAAVGTPTDGSWVGGYSAIGTSTKVVDALDLLNTALVTIHSEAAAAQAGANAAQTTANTALTGATSASQALVGTPTDGSWAGGYSTIAASMKIVDALDAINTGMAAVSAAANAAQTTANTPGVLALGTPTDGTWTPGYVSLTAGTKIVDAVDLVNKSLVSIVTLANAAQAAANTAQSTATTAVTNAAAAQSAANAAQSTANSPGILGVGTPTDGSWTGGYGAFSASTKIVDALDSLNTGLAAIQTAANAAQSTANTGVTNAATAQSAANAAQSTANTAVTNAATAQTAANTAIANAATAQTAANAAQATANTPGALGVGTPTDGSWTGGYGAFSASTKIVDALDGLNSGLAVVQSAAAAAQSAATTAQSTANTGVTNATTAQTAANAAQSTANTAITNAATALSAANAAQTTANSPGILAIGTPTDGTWTPGYMSLTASTKIVDAIDLVNEGLTTAIANAAAAQSSATTGVTNAATAQATANAAQSTANTAVTNAAAAQSTANTAITNAAASLSAANSAQATANAPGLQAMGNPTSGGLTGYLALTTSTKIIDALQAINAAMSGFISGSGGTVATLAITSLTASTLSVSGASSLGSLNATSGTFSTTLGVSGTTSLSAMSATSGAFSAAVTMASTLAVTGVTSLAAVSATTGTFTAGISGTTLSLSGSASLAAVSGTTGTFTGTLSGTTGTFSGAVSSAAFAFTLKSQIQSPADGYLTLLNNAATGFTGLRFGGVSSSFPMVKASGTTLAARLADDTADAPLTAGTFTASGAIKAAAGSASAPAYAFAADPGTGLLNPSSIAHTLAAAVNGNQVFVITPDVGVNGNFAFNAASVPSGATFLFKASTSNSSNAFVFQNTLGGTALTLRDNGYAIFGGQIFAGGGTSATQMAFGLINNSVGFFLPATNVGAAAANGIEAFRWTKDTGAFPQVAIGATSPATGTTLLIQGQTATSAAIPLNVTDSASVSLLKVTGDGAVTLGSTAAILQVGTGTAVNNGIIYWGTPGSASAVRLRKDTVGATLAFEDGTGNNASMTIRNLSTNGQIAAASGGLWNIMGVQQIYQNVTANKTLIGFGNNDVFNCYDNAGQSTQWTLTLPTTNYSGTSFIVCNQISQGISIKASGTDIIRLPGSDSTAGGRQTTTQIGASIVLMRMAAGIWVATSFTGTWTAS